MPSVSALGEEECTLIRQFPSLVFDPLFERAPPRCKRGSGKIGKSGEVVLVLDNVSYEPTDVIYDTHVKKSLWGIDSHQNLRESAFFRNLEATLKKLKAERTFLGFMIPTPVARFSHYDATGVFTLSRDNLYNVHGTLQLTTFSKELLADALPAISPYALQPKAHSILGVQNLFSYNLSATFYTQDPDGSHWSIHCKAFEE